MLNAARLPFDTLRTGRVGLGVTFGFGPGCSFASASGKPGSTLVANQLRMELGATPNSLATGSTFCSTRHWFIALTFVAVGIILLVTGVSPASGLCLKHNTTRRALPFQISLHSHSRAYQPEYWQVYSPPCSPQGLDVSTRVS